MGFSDRWLNRNAEPKNTCTISTMPPAASTIVDIVQGFHESEIEMAAYPHLAPCPRHRGQWVYRGQACQVCSRQEVCPSWKDLGFDVSLDLPLGIPRLKGAMQ